MNRHRQTLILAHRGWSSAYPENTVIAMTKALALGADGLEFDVQLSADGVPVIMHDAVVDRTTDGTGRVDELTFAQLRLLNDAKLWEEDERIGWQPIPTLFEILDAAVRLNPTGVYNIELKVHNDHWRSLVDTVCSFVAGHPIAPRVYFTSFHHESVTYLKQRYPQFPIGLIFGGAPERPWETAKNFGAVAVSLDCQHVTDETILACQDAGISVGMWSVDDEVMMKRYMELGVHTIITKKPDAALRIRRDLR